tara:strand:- start:4491 stop:4607 length:117 start_codon:yes stop_codon:yes gene_type:complete
MKWPDLDEMPNKANALGRLKAVRLPLRYSPPLLTAGDL